ARGDLLARVDGLGNRRGRQNSDDVVTEAEASGGDHTVIIEALLQGDIGGGGGAGTDHAEGAGTESDGRSTCQDPSGFRHLLHKGVLLWELSPPPAISGRSRGATRFGL